MGKDITEGVGCILTSPLSPSLIEALGYVQGIMAILIKGVPAPSAPLFCPWPKCSRLMSSVLDRKRSQGRPVTIEVVDNEESSSYDIGASAGLRTFQSKLCAWSRHFSDVNVKTVKEAPPPPLGYWDWKEKPYTITSMPHRKPACGGIVSFHQYHNILIPS